jgi:hypothetical protein
MTTKKYEVTVNGMKLEFANEREFIAFIQAGTPGAKQPEVTNQPAKKSTYVLESVKDVTHTCIKIAGDLKGKSDSAKAERERIKTAFRDAGNPLYFNIGDGWYLEKPASKTFVESVLNTL